MILNKLMMVPMAVVLLIAVLSTLMSGSASYTSNMDLDGYGSGGITNNSGTEDISIEGVTDQTINVSGIQAGLAILIAGISVGIASGIRVFGSGLSDTAQKLIFMTAVYYGIWALFSVFAWSLLEDLAIFGSILWIMMTIIFTIGFAQDFNGSGASE